MPDWTRIKDSARGAFGYLGKEAAAIPSNIRLLHYHLYGYGSGDYAEWFRYRKKVLQEFTARHKRLHFLERFLPVFERIAARRQERWDRAVRSSAAYLSDKAALENQLAAEKERAEKSEKRASRLDDRVRELEDHPNMRLGKHIMNESQCGVIELDRDNRVVIANRNACAYLGVELEELTGRQPSEVVKEEEIFSRYAALFEASAEQFVRREMRFQPNTFEIRGVPLNIMAYASNLGTEKFPVYGGGFIVLSPYKPP